MIFFLLSCSTEYSERGACNPVEEDRCLLPFPNDFFINETTGQLELVTESLPVNIDGVEMSPEYFNEAAGFSIGSTLYFSLQGATTEGTVQWPQLDAYLDAQAKTVLIEPLI